jgi:hypothetical protein
MSSVKVAFVSYLRRGHGSFASQAIRWPCKALLSIRAAVGTANPMCGSPQHNSLSGNMGRQASSYLRAYALISTVSPAGCSL